MLTIRRETAEDVRAIWAVVHDAFRRPSEADLVDALRRSDALTLSVVAALDGRIVGHVAFSPVAIQSTAAAFEALALAPVAVTPDCQRQGIGSALIRWGLDECRRMGHGAIIVLGRPDYYGRFGFTPASAYGVQCPFAVPAEAFLLVELFPGAMRRRGGTVRYSPEFELVSCETMKRH